MEKSPVAATKGPSIFVLRCLSGECNGLLAYEVDRDNFLYVDLAWTARRAGEEHYLPCPHCGGRNILETQPDALGRERPRVTRFAA